MRCYFFCIDSSAFVLICSSKDDTFVSVVGIDRGMGAQYPGTILQLHKKKVYKYYIYIYIYK